MTSNEASFAPNYNSLERLISTVHQSGYIQSRFDDPEVSNEGPRFYWRFDVDISPPSAQKIGRILTAKEVQGNFFFLLDGESYNVFTPTNIEILNELRSNGHLVGLHVNEPMVGTDEIAIAQTLDWFQSVVTPIDNAVSFHRPSPNVLGKRYSAFLSAYDPRFFGQGIYFSDSRRSFAFMEGLESKLKEADDDLQLLLHPVWWYPVSGVNSLYELLVARRRREFDEYLETNFKRVFGEALSNEDRSPRMQVDNV